MVGKMLCQAQLSALWKWYRCGLNNICFVPLHSVRAWLKQFFLTMHYRAFPPWAPTVTTIPEEEEAAKQVMQPSLDGRLKSRNFQVRHSVAASHEFQKNARYCVAVSPSLICFFLFNYCFLDLLSFSSLFCCLSHRNTCVKIKTPPMQIIPCCLS